MGIGSLRRHHDTVVEINGAVEQTAPEIKAQPESTAVTVADLRELALEAGHDESEIKGLKKAELIKLLEN